MARSIVTGIFIGLACLLVLGVAPSLGADAWVASRAAGVTAFLAVTFDVLFGLFVSTGAVDSWIARSRVVEVHRWLSSVALALTALHALALNGDRFVRFDALVALGVLTAVAMLVVHASFDLLPRIGGYAWRKLHYLSFFVFAAATAHGIFAGSDTASLGMRSLYLVSVAAAFALVVHRAIRSWRVRKSRATVSAA